MRFSKVAVLVRQFANLSVRIRVSCPCLHCSSLWQVASGSDFTCPVWEIRQNLARWCYEHIKFRRPQEYEALVRIQKLHFSFCLNCSNETTHITAYRIQHVATQVFAFSCQKLKCINITWFLVIFFLHFQYTPFLILEYVSLLPEPSIFHVLSSTQDDKDKTCPFSGPKLEF